MAFNDVMNLRKSGKEEEAYNMAIADYNQDQNDIWTKRALSWCLYDGLKSSSTHKRSELFLSKLNELKDLEVPASDEMLWGKVVWPINAFVRDCSKTQNIGTRIFTKLFEIIRVFPFVKPSLEYSVLLNAFLTAKEWMEIVDFCDWWGLENFRKEDYECEVLPNGKKMPISLAESAYLAYAKALIAKKDKDAISAFIPKLQELAKKNPKMQYPNYYVGKLLLASGCDKKEAVSALLPFVRKKQSDFWAWQLLAEALEEDEQKYMACLLRAVHCHTPEHYLVKVYLVIAEAFKRLHYYADARFYLDKYCQLRTEAQAKISNEAWNMLHETWYAETEGQKLSYELDYISITNELLYCDVPETNAVVSFVNKDKKMVNVVFGKGKEGFFKYDRFIRKLNNGDSLIIRIQEVSADGFMKVFSARVSEVPVNSDYCKLVTGIVSSNMTMTAYFLKTENESFYIPSNIVEKMRLIIGEPIFATVLYSYNKKMKEWRWCCVTVKR